MLLTVSTTHRPATDLGYLLVKHPDRVHRADTAAGAAHVFFPEAGEDRCTAALLLEVDPERLSRGARRRSGRQAPEQQLGQYVNDRPYAASSLLTVAMARVFTSALKGQSRDRPELAGTAIPLEIGLPALPCAGGPELARRLLEPLGWTVEATPVPLDPAEWGDSRYLSVTLRGTLRLADALNHLYVLLPVFDGGKHYWVTTDEVDKLLRAGSGWLAGHPERDLITERYLAHQRALTRQAEDRLADTAALEESDEDTAGEDVTPDDGSRVPLTEQRRTAVLAALADTGATRVLDLGCGPGSLLLRLARDPRYTEIVGADVSAGALALAERRIARLPDRAQARITLHTTGLTYADARLAGYDAAILMEVVEHLDPDRLPALERAVFGHAAPHTVLVTTPNAEYNVRYEGLPHGTFRHTDHRFEWTRAQFTDWATAVAARHGYTVDVRGIGEHDPEVGTPSQLAVFSHQGTVSAHATDLASRA